MLNKLLKIGILFQKSLVFCPGWECTQNVKTYVLMYQSISLADVQISRCVVTKNILFYYYYDIHPINIDIGRHLLSSVSTTLFWRDHIRFGDQGIHRSPISVTIGLDRRIVVGQEMHKCMEWLQMIRGIIHAYWWGRGQTEYYMHGWIKMILCRFVRVGCQDRDNCGNIWPGWYTQPVQVTDDLLVLFGELRLFRNWQCGRLNIIQRKATPKWSGSRGFIAVIEVMAVNNIQNDSLLMDMPLEGFWGFFPVKLHPKKQLKTIIIGYDVNSV